MATRVIKDDRKKWDQFRKLVLEVSATKPGVYVGILPEDMSVAKETFDENGSNNTLGKVGLYNEFGTGTIPARSFIRAPFDETQGYQKLRKSIVKRLIEGALSLDSGLNILGSSIAKSFIKRIREGIKPDNAETTLSKKDSDTPLISTGQLIEHITYKIEK